MCLFVTGMDQYSLAFNYIISRSCCPSCSSSASHPSWTIGLEQARKSRKSIRRLLVLQPQSSRSCWRTLCGSSVESSNPFLSTLWRTCGFSRQIGPPAGVTSLFRVVQFLLGILSFLQFRFQCGWVCSSILRKRVLGSFLRGS